MSGNTADVLKLKNVDVSSVNFSSVKKGKNSQSVKIYYSKKPMYLQLPKLNVPFGASDYNGNGKYVVDLSMNGMDKDKDISMLHDVLYAMDGAVMGYAVENSVEWFGSEKDMEYVQSKYTRMLRQSNGNFAPTFKVKIMKDKSDKYTAEVYDDKSEQVSLDDNDVSEVLPKGCSVKTCVECLGVWFMNGKFGVSWRLVQAKVYPKSVKLEGYSFVDDDEEEEFSDIEP